MTAPNQAIILKQLHGELFPTINFNLKLNNC